MLKKYNFAFIPMANTSQFVQYAHKLSEHISPATYFLGQHSIPHISLCHFEADENDIECIWQAVTLLNIAPIKLSFNLQRSKQYPGHPKWGRVCWVSLMPDKIDELKKIHLSIVNNIITKPFNASYDDYDPHLTLFNSYDKNACLTLNENPIINASLNDTFCVALGNIDDNGQLINIL